MGLRVTIIVVNIVNELMLICITKNVPKFGYFLYNILNESLLKLFFHISNSRKTVAAS